jgi:hypothetical protein
MPAFAGEIFNASPLALTEDHSPAAPLQGTPKAFDLGLEEIRKFKEEAQTLIEEYKTRKNQVSLPSLGLKLGVGIISLIFNPFRKEYIKKAGKSHISDNDSWWVGFNTITQTSLDNQRIEHKEGNPPPSLALSLKYWGWNSAALSFIGFFITGACILRCTLIVKSVKKLKDMEYRAQGLKDLLEDDLDPQSILLREAFTDMMKIKDTSHRMFFKLIPANPFVSSKKRMKLVRRACNTLLAKLDPLPASSPPSS